MTKEESLAWVKSLKPGDIVIYSGFGVAGIILSIVKANGWFIVPMPVLVFCWVMSFVCWLIYSYALGVGEGAAKEMKKKVHGEEGGQHERVD